VPKASRPNRSSSAQRRKSEIASRSRTVASHGPPSQPTPFGALTLYYVGGVLCVLAVGLLALMVVRTARGDDLREFSGGEAWGDNLITAPFLILMFASAPLFLAEYHRRGLWFTRERGFLQGGSNVVVLRPARLWSRALWLLVSILAWVVVIAIPVHLDITTDAFVDADSSLWTLLVAHGVFASGMTVVLLFSLLKRLTYERLAARYGAGIVYGSSSQLFWRFVSYQFRFELWFAFGCGAMLGTLPLVFHAAADDCYLADCIPVPDAGWLAWIVCIAVGCAALALLGCLNAWRSGKALFSGESVS
jgi:hypothetical protein